MDRIFAILGDIHANLEALNVVLDDCRALGVTDFICTGDIVGYNACPHECLEIVRGLNFGAEACPVVMGNHDFYVSKKSLDRDDFNENAAQVIDWTINQLTMKDFFFLKSMPFAVTKMGMTVVHSTLDHPENFGYVFDVQQSSANFIHQITPLCFHGHTHFPYIFEKQMSGIFGIRPADLPPENDGCFELKLGRKYFINVGSVGQPRDGDPRSSYVVYNPKLKRLAFRRLEYDVVAAQERIIKAGLPSYLAERLAVGK